MLQLFRNNTPYTVLILFIFTLLVKLQALIHPIAPVELPHNLVYDFCVHALGTVLGHSSFGFTMLTVVLLFGQGIYLTSITARHRLFLKPSYLPAFAYISLTAILPAFNYFSPQLIVNWLLLLVFDIFLHFTQPQNPRKYIFNAGFLLALAALVQFSAIGYLLFFIIALLILRPFNPGEWVVAFLGYFTPVYFLAGILYLANKLSLLRHLPDIGISLPKQMPHPLYQVGVIISLLLLLASGGYVLNDIRARQAISVRRGWTCIVIWLIVSLLVGIFTPAGHPAAWLVIMPPLSLIAAQPLTLEKSRRFSNFIFLLFIAIIFYCQFTVYK